MKKNFLKIIVFVFILCRMSTTFSMNANAEEAEAEVTTMDYAVSFVGEELNDPIDGMWQCMKENNDLGGALEASPQSIQGDGTILTLMGYQSGGNTQYAYTDMDEFHNKLIKTTMVFDGELPSIDGSFIAFAFRAEGYSSKFFWDTSSYSIILKGGSIEVQKHPSKYQSQDNNLGGAKGKTPIVVKMETPFTAGTHELEMGVLDGISPNTGKESVNIIFRLNGVELVNVWDDSERTPHISRKGYFLVAPIYTQVDVEDDTKGESRSSISFLSSSLKPEGNDQNTNANNESDMTSNITNETEETTNTLDDTMTERNNLYPILIGGVLVVAIACGIYFVIVRKKNIKKGQ